MCVCVCVCHLCMVADTPCQGLDGAPYERFEGLVKQFQKLVSLYMPVHVCVRSCMSVCVPVCVCICLFVHAFMYLCTLRLQLIAGTDFSVFALRVFGIY